MFHLRPFIDPNAISSENNGGINDNYSTAKYYQDPGRPKDGHNIHYVNNGLRFNGPGDVGSAANPKRATQMFKYPNPTAVLYLTCFADDPNGIQSNSWYADGNEMRIAIYYDMKLTNHVTGGGMQGNANNRQRVAPKRHGQGANGLFLDGHANTVRAENIVKIETWDDGDYSIRDGF